METKLDKARELAYECNLYALIIDDLCNNQIDKRVIAVLGLLGMQPGYEIWKDISLEKFNNDYQVYRDLADAELVKLVESFIELTGEIRPEDLTIEFMVEAARMLSEVGKLAAYIQKDGLMTKFLEACLTWMQLCQKVQKQLPGEILVRVIGALQANGLVPLVIFKEKDDYEDDPFYRMAAQAARNGGLAN